MAKCAACGKFLSQTGAASCTGCPCMFHKVCVAIPENGTVPRNWTCPECKKKIRKSDNSDTPVKGVCGTNSPPATASVPPVSTFSAEELQKHSFAPAPLEEDSEIRAMRRELAEYMSEFRKEMCELRGSLAGILEQKEMVAGSKEITELESKVTQLKLELNDRDQETLLADLDIECLPEQNGENIIHTVSMLASKLGVTLENRDIVYAERVGSARPNIAASDSNEVGRQTRRVVVRLARRQLRDELLHAARVRRNFTTTDMGYGGPSQRVYVNERLTRANRLLFHRAREACRKHQWRYSWTKKGRIFVRQCEGRPAHCIRSDNDLSRVFDVNTV
ncbi:hypothetical protein K1T71_015035 [Dendrolimus kikuchii]|nr:hypothetical protein K1T71_015035 [Dendrolimus kikuchii]